MIRPVLICGLIVSWVAIALADPPKEQADTVTIPLDEIWAFNMPGTRDVRELEPNKFGEDTTALASAERLRLMHESLTQRILDSLVFLEHNKGEKTTPGFAVLGVGRKALKASFSILVDGSVASSTFAVGDDVTLVFFSHMFGDYVHVEEIDRQDSRIEIRYRFIPHMSKDMSKHFALIPIGRLPAGEYQVELIQLPLPAKFGTDGEKVVPDDMVDWIVCKPFSFSIVDKE